MTQMAGRLRLLAPGIVRSLSAGVRSGRLIDEQSALLLSIGGGKL